MSLLSSGSRSAALCGLVERLEREDGVTRRQIAERLDRRSLRYRKKALNLTGEAVKIGLENRWTHVRWKLACGVGAAPHRADKHDFTRCPGVAHPVGIASGADEIALPVEIERVDWQRDRPAALSSVDFENVEVASDQADTNEKHEHAAKHTLEGTRLEIAPGWLGHLPAECPSRAAGGSRLQIWPQPPGERQGHQHDGGDQHHHRRHVGEV